MEVPFKAFQQIKDRPSFPSRPLALVDRLYQPVQRMHLALLSSLNKLLVPPLQRQREALQAHPLHQQLPRQAHQMELFLQSLSTVQACWPPSLPLSWPPA
jgi:hypothetical protein